MASWQGEGPSPKIPEAYTRLRKGVTVVTRFFFRRLEVAGIEHIPSDRGGILVAWHPNAIVDALIIRSVFPYQVIFGGRHGLFRYPLLGRVMKAVGEVPIYRRQDLKGMSVQEQRERNQEGLDALADRIGAGSFSALFPEGDSHDAPFLQELKSGAARIFYRARALTPEERPPPVIIPVGIHYDHKRVFRSRALVECHPPVELPAELDVTPPASEDPEQSRERARGADEDHRRDTEARGARNGELGAPRALPPRAQTAPGRAGPPRRCQPGPRRHG